MAKRLTGTILVLALCLGAATDARAQTSCVVLGVEPLSAPPALAARLSQEIASRVNSSPKYTLQKTKDLQEVKLIFGCLDEDPSCMATAGKSLDTDKLIWGNLKKTPAGYNFTIKLLDVNSARIEKFISENYTLQELDESRAAAVVATLTSDFLVESRGNIQLSCDRPGAQIFLGDRAVGLTEQGPLLLREILPGTHTVKVTLKGFQPWLQDVIVESGKTLELSARLTPLAMVPPGTASQPDTRADGGDDRKGWKIAFWTGLAVTLASTIVATPMGIQAWSHEDSLQTLLNDKYSNSTAFPNARRTDVCESVDGSWPPTDVQTLCDNGKTQAALSTAFFITAGAAAMATAVFGYLAFSSEATPEHGEPADEEASTWRLIPGAGPQGARIDLRFNF